MVRTKASDLNRDWEGVQSLIGFCRCQTLMMIGISYFTSRLDRL